MLVAKLSPPAGAGKASERIADGFARVLLLPKMLIKRYGTKDLAGRGGNSQGVCNPIHLQSAGLAREGLLGIWGANLSRL